MAGSHVSQFDLVVAGPVYLDLTLADLDATPRPGTEVRAASAASGPGGVATVAVAAARLGLRTAVVSALGADAAGWWCRQALRGEGIDLSATPALPEWPTPVTVCIARDGDRELITHEVPAPVWAPQIPTARATICDVRRLRTGSAAGAQLVVADVGWDATGRWDPADLEPLAECDVFVPNAAEALAYTRADSPRAAARVLAERVRAVVVTCGEDGVIAVDGDSGEEHAIPAVPVRAIDTTGAGDVLAAGLTAGLLNGWSLHDAAEYAVLCSGLSVRRLGSAVSAPDRAEVAAWLVDPRHPADLRDRYAFLGG